MEKQLEMQATEMAEQTGFTTEENSEVVRVMVKPLDLTQFKASGVYTVEHDINYMPPTGFSRRMRSDFVHRAVLHHEPFPQLACWLTESMADNLLVHESDLRSVVGKMIHDAVGVEAVLSYQSTGGNIAKRDQARTDGYWEIYEFFNEQDS